MKDTIKSIVIKVAIAFIVIVALLTYFSGTIDNYLLPHVTVTTGSEGTLKYDLHTSSTLEKTESDGKSALSFRFQCDKTMAIFLQTGTTVNVKVSVKVGENEYAYCDGSSSISGIRETEEGFECTAVLEETELQNGISEPAAGDAVIIDNEFESARYKHVVMKSAIQNNSYVYLVAKGDDGKHYISKADVTIVAESDFYAAVDMSAESLPIVLTCSKEIGEGQRVIVDG